jgi:uncharacterized membrane protein YeiH
MRTLSLFTIIDFLGVIAGALGGALAARRSQTHQYDLVGVLGLGTVAALGGGIIRDILIQRGPPLALLDVRYLYAALAGALVGLLFGSGLGTKTQRLLIVLDAAALSLFAVAGATRALNAGLSMFPALLLGAVTAVGGGALRDVLNGRTPKVFEGGELYAIIAAIAAAIFLLCRLVGISTPTASGIGIGSGFSLRLLALRFSWQTKAIRARSFVEP